MSRSEVEYFEQRAETERALMRSCADRKAAALHQELARAYEAKVRDKRLDEFRLACD